MSSYGRVFTAPVGGVDKDIDNVGVRGLDMDSRFDMVCGVLGILSLLGLLGSIVWMGVRLFFG